ncbi:hypothetical protein HanRHA438_Chr17g0837921 [Helianthus annuus]|nr:hypothetical protein HanRHA438_Chr17g0837921 [Helianthus annuus]
MYHIKYGFVIFYSMNLLLDLLYASWWYTMVTPKSVNRFEYRSKFAYIPVIYCLEYINMFFCGLLIFVMCSNVVPKLHEVFIIYIASNVILETSCLKRVAVKKSISMTLSCYFLYGCFKG